jgi:hypothetical protein
MKDHCSVSETWGIRRMGNKNETITVYSGLEAQDFLELLKDRVKFNSDVLKIHTTLFISFWEGVINLQSKVQLANNLEIMIPQKFECNLEQIT